MEADNIERKKTWPTAAKLVLLSLVIIAIIALVIYAVTRPGVSVEIWKPILIIIAAAILIFIAVKILIAVLAIPVYIYKGEKTQTGGDYGLDDMKSVKETDSEKDKPN